MNNEALKTGFDREDLTIRNRVLAYKAALDATTKPAPIRDDLLMQFTREVADLSAQLAQVENSFGPNDPMAQVLREALGSARSRRDTRRIEMGMEPEQDEQRAKKPAVVPPQQPVVAKDDTIAWMLLVLLAWDRSRAKQAEISYKLDSA